MSSSEFRILSNVKPISSCLASRLPRRVSCPHGFQGLDDAVCARCIGEGVHHPQSVRALTIASRCCARFSPTSSKALTIASGATLPRDPSLVDGFQVLYDREVSFASSVIPPAHAPTLYTLTAPRLGISRADSIHHAQVSIEVRNGNEQNQGVGDMAEFRVKVLVLGDDDRPQNVRLELTTDSDLFFHYFHTVDGKAFDVMRSRQKLMIPFQKYTDVLIATLNNCVKRPRVYMSVLYVNANGTARLDFIQNMEYKFVELLSVRFTRSPDEAVRQQIAYRYNAVKTQLQRVQAKLAGINKLIRARNPSLLQHLNLTSQQ